MRTVISVSLPEDMASKLDNAAKESGRARSEIIKESLRAYLWEGRFKKLKKSLVRKAKAAGVVTDNDVFKVIS
ncbi:MAG: CopG family transcriptional regulator [Nitrospirae bacterium CG_4_10_14_0_8_um_filter_41_23]|nr:ribbon-helix-helix protein, CopG family [bacterium]PIQ95152.1 MAG: CopG family transcriptional regulator [Nitrospirae bacterium CG11_big_fil_rev_8_21_14_0_20_41_14]PIV41093.1 MAG: CopG family transcriptional regulator [Nitrospirae bacterium CG02_land_8_20_14_3_00_41_53]PIW86337.1 MAG: CopG family transcriptional regulator [Nitrospirae bacterium CG_4_8_14_3_um_filter_41_47]PIY87513.1 MAG: CopG family transcriptional regulator [Nitrospirae bacterium CG_4_10_14_0_8_um_filter_41_23]PJA79157.1 M